MIGDPATETFLVNLSGVTNAVIGDGQGVGTIVNDDLPPPSTPPPPSVTPGATTVNPGAPITFTIQNGPGNPTDWVGLYDTNTVSNGGYLGGSS